MYVALCCTPAFSSRAKYVVVVCVCVWVCARTLFLRCVHDVCGCPPTLPSARAAVVRSPREVSGKASKQGAGLWPLKFA